MASDLGIISAAINTITEKPRETRISGTWSPKTSRARRTATPEATMMVTMFRIRMAVRNWLGSRSSLSRLRLPATFSSAMWRTRSLSTEVRAVSEPDAKAATSSNKTSKMTCPHRSLDQWSIRPRGRIKPLSGAGVGLWGSAKSERT